MLKRNKKFNTYQKGLRRRNRPDPILPLLWYLRFWSWCWLRRTVSSRCSSICWINIALSSCWILCRKISSDIDMFGGGNEVNLRLDGAATTPLGSPLDVTAIWGCCWGGWNSNLRQSFQLLPIACLQNDSLLSLISSIWGILSKYITELSTPQMVPSNFNWSTFVCKNYKIKLQSKVVSFR